jgi:hypothetical protein
MGTFDNAWNIGHDEGPAVGKTYDTEVRLEGGKRIIGDLGSGRRDN